METTNLIQQAFLNYPGFCGVLDLNSKLIQVNNTGLKWIGFRSSDSVVGISYANLNCKAAEDAPTFLQQDSLVKKRQEPITFLGYYCYAQNEWKVILGKKYLIFDDQQQPQAILSQFQDISAQRLVDLSRYLIKTQEQYFHQKQFCVLVDHPQDSHILTNRERECLFFLLRGKTAKQTSQILSISFRTVEGHFNRIKEKLDCNNKNQLIEKCLQEGYFNLLPPTLIKTLENKSLQSED